MNSNQWRERAIHHYNEATRLLCDVWTDSVLADRTSATANIHATLAVAAFTAILADRPDPS